MFAKKKAAGKQTSWFAVWVTTASVVVVGGIAALVVAMNAVAAAPAVAPTASNVDQTTGAIAFGDGPNTVDTYVDFMCPYCGQFESTEGKTIQKLLDAGDITLNVHPVALLDRFSQGTEYSSRAAAAMFAIAAADPANAYAFMTAMFENQPAEQTAGLSNEEIIELAKGAGVEMTSALEADIIDQKYVDFAKQQKLPEGAQGTPTLLVNGELVQVTFDPKKDIVERLT